MKHAWLAIVMIVVPIVAGSGGNTNPGDPDGLQGTWYLDKDKYNGAQDPHGQNNYHMSRDIPATRQITINQHTAYFVGDAPASQQVAFGRLSWDLILWCNADNTVEWSVGFWKDGSFHGTGPGALVTCPAGQSETDYHLVQTTFEPSEDLVIPAGGYLAIQITDNQGNMKLHAGEGQSRLVPHEAAPDPSAPGPQVVIDAVASPTDSTIHPEYLFQDTTPGSSTQGISWVRIAITEAPVSHLQFRLGDMMQAQDAITPQSGLRIHVQDAGGQPVATGSFRSDTVTFVGEWLGTYYARLEHDRVGMGPNAILPAGTYSGPLTITAIDIDPWFLQRPGILSAAGPDAQGGQLTVAPGAVLDLAGPALDIAPGQWRIQMDMDGDAMQTATLSLVHVHGDGSETIIGSTDRVPGVVDWTVIGTQHIDHHDGQVVLRVAWPGPAATDLSVWTHGEAGPSKVQAPVLATA